jgi:PAP2 superfamily C-terminal
MIKTLLLKYKSAFSERTFVRAFVVSMVLLIAALVINFYAGLYATESASNPVTDIILSNIPVFDLDAIFVYGAFVLVLFIAFVCIIEPRRSLFVLRSISLFVIIRSIFISLTHIGPFPTQTPIDFGDITFMSKFIFGGDLFFSGHTGLPFLLSLVFWNHKVFRSIFLVMSIMFAVVVLLCHLHYTIDVAAAFFITYTIYQIACGLFKKEKEVFDSVTSRV